jgi:rhodanese-related sulfurtransferase
MRFNSRSAWVLVLASLLMSVGSAHAQSTKPAVQRIDVNEFDHKRKAADAVVLDVRTPHEFAAGHVPGAVNLDVHDPKFKEKVAGLDKSRTYLVHCAMGVRSEAATKKMAALGFPHLFDFHGGFKAWENAHKPIEKGEGKNAAAEGK